MSKSPARRGATKSASPNPNAPLTPSSLFLPPTSTPPPPTTGDHNIRHQTVARVTNRARLNISYSSAADDFLSKNVLQACAWLQMCIGAFMFVFMLTSFISPDYVLAELFGFKSNLIDEKISANSWAQTAIAFGMHAYADIANGWEAYHYESGTISSVVTVWNSTRFLISFLWVLQFIGGIGKVHGFEIVRDWPLFSLAVIALLIFDTLILRPVMVFCQRKINDRNPPAKNLEDEEWEGMTSTQKFCRGVFYYEAIISGMSGCAYFLFPQLFLWLYFPSYQANSQFDIAAWSLSQFGANVMAFGLYQMSADIDSRTGHIIWWLVLDVVWMYLYWSGVKAMLGDWNPWTFSGANFWCHAAFHADSTLAIARTIFLYTLQTNGRKSKINKE